MAPSEQALAELRDAHRKGIVLGLQGVSKTVERLDVDVLLTKYPKTFNLFVLALDKLQHETPPSDKMSYFQIAGIHGLPRTLWDGVGGKTNAADRRQWVGYCAHGQPTFPSWHRPYMALMEQALYLKMMEIAESYASPHKASYIEAAQQFRLPYWDFHRPRGGRVRFPGVVRPNRTTDFPFDYSVPKIFSETDVRVRVAPNNEIQSLGRNPFNLFAFPGDWINPEEWTRLLSTNAQFDKEGRQLASTELRESFNELRRKLPSAFTTRYPKEQTSANVQDTERLNKVMNELRMDNNRDAVLIMTDIDRFETFYQELEGMHGTYHGLIGGYPYPAEYQYGGHMSRVPVAAFDPIFWMYHCNIERLFAIWQTIHPNSWFRQSADDDLLPFRKPKAQSVNDCWSSNEVRNPQSFGVTYPDLSPTVRNENVLAEFRKKYEWSIPLLNAGRIGQIPDSMKPLDLSTSEFFVSTAQQTPQFSLLSAAQVSLMQHEPAIQLMAAPEAKALAAPEDKAVATPGAKTVTAPKAKDEPPKELDDEFSREWFLQDEVQRLALNGAFSIFYFIMDKAHSLPPTTDFVMEPSLAGITHVFAAPEQFCDNCGLQAQQAATVKHTVQVTSLLQDYVATGALPSMKPEHVKPFLVEGLKWRVVSVNAELQDSRFMAEDKGFKVNVGCKVAKLPRGSDEVQYESYPEIFEQIVANASSAPTTAST